MTMDIIRRFLPALSESRVVMIGRLTATGFLLLAVVWAAQLEHFGSLWQYLQAVLAYAVPPVVALFGIGLFWRGANPAGAFATAVFGSACGLALFLCNAVFQVTHIHFLYAAPLLLAIDAAILVFASLWSSGRGGARIDSLMFTVAAFRDDSRQLKGVPWWRNYRVQAVVLLAVTACIVITFR